MAPKISVVVPIHDMENGEFFLWRNINSILNQSFQDFEIVITKHGKMAENTNAGMKKARGEIIKILYLDDYLANPFALQNIVDAFTPDTHWLASGCLHQQDDETSHSPHHPKYTDDISTGNNLIGSPSVIALRREGLLYFDENLSWLLDCDLYKRYHDKYGPPDILNSLDVIIGIGSHQTTHKLSDVYKKSEHHYLNDKYNQRI